VAGTFTLKKLECSKQAICLNNGAWNNGIDTDFNGNPSLFPSENYNSTVNILSMFNSDDRYLIQAAFTQLLEKPHNEPWN
jgi:hypothetical protein